METTINLSPEIIELLAKIINRQSSKAGSINVGQIVTIGGIEWIVLEKMNECFFCLSKDILPERRTFGTFKTIYSYSNIRDWLVSKFASELMLKTGYGSLLPTKFIAGYDDDGKPFGIINDMVRLLTVEEYTRYKGIILPHYTNDEWWLASVSDEPLTLDSPLVVGSTNKDAYHFLNNIPCGVRPCCMFNYSVLEE